MASQPTILVADDSATMRMILQAALSAPGWRVLAAPDGQAALDQASSQETPIDLVVTDWNMPVMGGQGFIQGLRAMPRYASVPVLVLTTEEDAVSKSAARELGAIGWLNKPVDPEALVELAIELLGDADAASRDTSTDNFS